MLPVQLINLVQISLKHFFDIDPFISEHVVRLGAAHIASASEAITGAIRSLDLRISESLTPVVADIRNMRLSFTEG